MKKRIKITKSPFTDSIEIIGNLIIDVVALGPNNKVTINLNPNIQEYVDKFKNNNLEIRQLSVITETINSKTINFDLQNYNLKTFNFDDETYNFKLLNIGTEKIENQDFYTCEFEIEWFDSSDKTGGAIDFQIVPKVNENNPTQFILDIGDVNNLNSKRISILIDKDFDLIFRLTDLDGKVVELRNESGNLWKAEEGFRVIFSWNNNLIKHKLININEGKSQDIEKEIKEIKTFHMWDKHPMIIGANLNGKQNAKMEFNELKIFSKPTL